MGKGDRKTLKGKRRINSYGKVRKQKKVNPLMSWARKRVRILNNKNVVDSNAINQAVFPIMSQDDDGYFFIGTGFFINELGWFITAKHVAIDDNADTIKPFVVIQLISEGEFQPRQVVGVWHHPTADITIGKLRPMYSEQHIELTNPSLIIKEGPIRIDKEIYSYGYPNSRIDAPDGNYQIGHFDPFYYFGRVKSITQRDDTFFKGMCIQSNMIVKGGASGGPVLDNNGFVIGINTSGYNLVKGQEPISFTTMIQDAFDITLPYRNGENVESITFKELMDRGAIITNRNIVN